MTDRIDCSLQSHAACLEPDVASGEPPAPPRQGGAPVASTYECIDDCLSSLGVAQLVSGVVVGLGCIVSRPACAVLIGGSAGALAGWCDAKCDEAAVDAKR